jgi:gluconate 2-dehydrogenase gamma chain
MNTDKNITRRTVIAGATFVPLAALTARAQAPAAALSADQMKLLEAFVDRLVPSDENGPGAVEMGAATYIDRTLATANAAEKPSFVEGLAGVESLARSVHNASFADLTPAQRDELLTAMDSGAATNLRPFFNRVRRLTLEGMFCDPYYGGNKNFAGWDLIRYPGPRLAVAPEDQKMSTPPKPYRRSAYGNQTQTR